jgi:hypothetical protein
VSLSEGGESLPSRFHSNFSRAGLKSGVELAFVISPAKTFTKKSTIPVAHAKGVW